MSDRPAATRPDGALGALDPAVLRQALESSAIASALVATDGAFLWVNPALSHLFGRGEEELLLATWQELTHPDDVAVDQALAGEVLSGERDSYRLRKRYRRRDGAIVWGDLTVSCVREARGEFLCFLAQIVDVTEQMQIDRRYLALSESAADFLTQVGPDGALSWVSPGVTAVLGWAPEELVGLPLQELMHPDDGSPGLPGDEPASATAAAPGRSVSRLRAKDGSYTWLESVAQAIPAVDGAVPDSLAAWRDVSEQVGVERRLRESEERYRMLAEYASDAVFSASPQGVFDYVSPAVRHLLGWRAEEMVGRTPMDFIHPEDREVLAARMAAVTSGESASFRIRFRTADGGYHWIGPVVHPVLDRAGNLVGRAGSWRDAEPEVAAEQALRDQAEQLRAALDSEIDPRVTLTAVRDAAGRIVDFAGDYANRAALAELAMAPEEFGGTRLSSLLPDRSAAAVEACARTVDTGEPLLRDGIAFPSDAVESPRLLDIRGAALGDGISLTWRDVTARAVMTQALAESEERFRLLAYNSADVVMLCRDGRISWVSPALTAQLGWSPEDWEGRSDQDFTLPEDRELQHVEWEKVAAGASRVFRVRIRDEAGAQHWVEVHAAPYREQSGRQSGVLASFRVIDEEVLQEQRLDRLATVDGLTGLLNREPTLEQVHGMASHSPRAGTGLAALYVDIDGFKPINDQYGHAAGDVLLKAVASRISEAVRADDLVGRLGGDEILVALLGVDDVQQAVAVAEKIRRAVAAPIELCDGCIVEPSISIGAALAAPGEPIEQLVARADAAMYEAKRAGRNRVCAAS